MFEWKTKTDDQIVKFVTGDSARSAEVRRSYEDLWTLENKLFRPRRTDLRRDQPKGQRFGAEVYSDRPALAMRKFNYGFWGYSAAKKDPWLQFGPSRVSLLEDDDIRKYCQEAAEQTLWGFNRSTFYRALPACGEDACISTGVMIPEVEEETGRVIFETIHPGESYLQVDAYGRYCVYHRKYKMTALAALDKFGEKALGGAEAKIVINAKEKNPQMEYDFLYGIYKNSEYDAGSRNSLAAKYICFHIQLGASANGKTGRLVQKIGRQWFPIVYSQMAEQGSPYGRGLAGDALTAALVGNKLAEKEIRAAHLAVEPRFKASQTLRGRLRVDPGSTTFIRGSDEIYEALKENINWPLSDAQMDKINAAIDEWFFGGLFGMLTDREVLPETAFLTAEMKAEKVVLMGPIIGESEDMILEPAVEIIFEQEQNGVVQRYGSYGRMPDPPQRLLDEGGGSIDPIYVGQLAQIQRSVMRAQPIRDSLDFIDRMAANFPESLLIVNAKKMLEDGMRATGLRQDLIYDERQIEEREKLLAEKEMVAEQAEMMQGAAQAAPHISKKVEAGSVLAELAG